MKRLLGSILAATCAIYIIDPPLVQSQTPIAYMLAQIDTPMWAPLDINDKGDVLFERQLAESAPPVPIVLNRNGKESAPFECPGTTNDTAGYAMNCKREVAGTCNGRIPVAFVVNMNSGEFKFLNAPGAVANWALGINDSGDVVGSTRLRWSRRFVVSCRSATCTHTSGKRRPANTSPSRATRPMRRLVDGPKFAG